MNYYNENDPSAAAWLRGLIAAGLIPMGDVDERSIADVQSGDLRGYVQCHFFAGIAGWSLALQLAGWPSDRPVWTGSCPCQPYSGAGKGLGDADPRNLWPQMFRLIRECRPATVFGEQVSSAIRHGWLDGICADLEGADYAVGAHVLGAHSAGAPHIRQRLFWVADNQREQRQGLLSRSRVDSVEEGGGETAEPSGHRAASRMDHAASDGLDNWASLHGKHDGKELVNGCESRGLGQSNGARREPGEHAAPGARYGGSVESASNDGGMANGILAGLERHSRDGDDRDESRRIGAEPFGPVATSCAVGRMGNPENEHGARISGEIDGRIVEAGRPSAWGDSQWHQCRDGKARRIATEPALFPLADGLPYRVGKRGSIRAALLKGAGNAIVPQVAAEFIKAFMSI